MNKINKKHLTRKIWEKVCEELKEAEFTYYYKYMVTYEAENENWAVRIVYGGDAEDVYRCDLYPGKKIKLEPGDFDYWTTITVIDKKNNIEYSIADYY